MFPGEKGKATTWGWLHKTSTARQEDRAQQGHQPLSRVGLRRTERDDSTGRTELAWGQHRALAGHPEEASSDKQTAAHSSWWRWVSAPQKWNLGRTSRV